MQLTGVFIWQFRKGKTDHYEILTKEPNFNYIFYFVQIFKKAKINIATSPPPPFLSFHGKSHSSTQFGENKINQEKYISLFLLTRFALMLSVKRKSKIQLLIFLFSLQKSTTILMNSSRYGRNGKLKRHSKSIPRNQ